MDYDRNKNMKLMQTLQDDLNILRAGVLGANGIISIAGVFHRQTSNIWISFYLD